MRMPATAKSQNFDRIFASNDGQMVSPLLETSLHESAQFNAAGKSGQNTTDDHFRWLAALVLLANVQAVSV